MYVIFMEVIVNRNNKRKFDKEKIFSIVASLTLVAVLVVCVVAVAKTARGKNKNYIDLNIAKNTTTQAEAPTTKEIAINRTTEAPTEKTTEKATEKIEAETLEKQTTAAVEAADIIKETAVEVNAPVYHFTEGSKMVWPLKGEIILGYNMDNTIYFPTLDQYKCNPAMVIAGDVGDDVVSAAAGIVEDVFQDTITGTTMVIAIGDGYKIKLGNLGNLAVGVGSEVMAGTKIGKIAEPTKYFTKEGSNLYFAVTKNGDSVNPLMYLPE